MSLSRDEIQALRGKQVRIGVNPQQPPRTFSFIVPTELPWSGDEEESDRLIIEREKVIAQISHALNPYRDVLALGSALMKALRVDIETVMEIRERPMSEDAPLFASLAPEAATKRSRVGKAEHEAARRTGKAKAGGHLRDRKKNR